MTRDFLDLPTELLIRCLFFLGASDLLACQQTNEFFYSLITQSSILQYIIELEAAYAEDNPSSTLPISERLKRLKRRQQAWTRFDIKQVVTVPVRHRPSGIYDFTGGVCILGEAFSSNSRPTKALQYLRLPSLDEDMRGEIPWKKIDVRDDIVDIGLALQEHDLIAVVTSRQLPSTIFAATTATFISVELLQFSTSRPHPLASQAVIPVREVTSTFGHISIGIEIVGDLLVLLLTFPFAGIHARDYLYVYEWKTGTLKMTYDADSLTYTAFTFISPTSIALPNMLTGDIELCHLVPPNSESANGEAPKPPTRLRVTCKLSLPLLLPERRIIRMACRGEPNPSPISSTSTPREEEVRRLYPHDNAPFHDSADDSIIIFNMLIQNEPLLQQVTSVSFVVHRSTLVYYLETETDRHSHRSSPYAPEYHQFRSTFTPPIQAPPMDVAPIMFDKWGPEATRWFVSDNTQTRWITTTCGQRYITVSENLPSPITVLDFGQNAVKRTLRLAEKAKENEIMRQEQRRMESQWQGDVWAFAVREPEQGFSRSLSSPPPDLSARSDLEEIDIGDGRTVKVYTRPVMLPRHLKVFAEDVWSALPYVKTESQEVYNYDALLMDEERAIGLFVDDENDKVMSVDILYLG